MPLNIHPLNVILSSGKRKKSNGTKTDEQDVEQWQLFV
jgi:hypothetical protein